MLARIGSRLRIASRQSCVKSTPATARQKRVHKITIVVVAFSFQEKCYGKLERGVSGTFIVSSAD